MFKTKTYEVGLAQDSTLKPGDVILRRKAANELILSVHFDGIDGNNRVACKHPCNYPHFQTSYSLLSTIYRLTGSYKPKLVATVRPVRWYEFWLE